MDSYFNLEILESSEIFKYSPRLRQSSLIFLWVLKFSLYSSIEVNNLAENIRESFPVRDDFLPSPFCFHILGHVSFKTFALHPEDLCCTISLSDG